MMKNKSAQKGSTKSNQDCLYTLARKEAPLITTNIHIPEQTNNFRQIIQEKILYFTLSHTEDYKAKQNLASLSHSLDAEKKYYQ